MSRYIDAEWLKGQINTTFWAEIGKIIDNAQTIDIVRCKECIFSEIDTEAEMCRCRNHSFPCWAKFDDFCSYGERSKDE